MDPLVPWLLLLIAGLVVACASMHSRLREVESASNARQSIVADELKDAEVALVAALDRLRRMDQTLAERESRLCGPARSMAAPAAYDASLSGSAGRSDCLEDLDVPGGGERPARAPEPMRSHDPELPRTSSASADLAGTGIRSPAAMPPDWRMRAVELAGTGLSCRQIARELERPVGEVELVLALVR
jgi:hypothetical protein